MGTDNFSPEDINAIRDLALSYAQAADRCDSMQYAENFIEDGILDGSGYYRRGHEDLSEVPGLLAGNYLKTFHAVMNHRISVTGNAAQGEVYTLAHHLSKNKDGKLIDFVMHMRYEDQYVRMSQNWKFAHRRIVVDWTELREAHAFEIGAPIE